MADLCLGEELSASQRTVFLKLSVIGFEGNNKKSNLPSGSRTKTDQKKEIPDEFSQLLSILSFCLQTSQHCSFLIQSSTSC